MRMRKIISRRVERRKTLGQSEMGMEMTESQTSIAKEIPGKPLKREHADGREERTLPGTTAVYLILCETFGGGCFLPSQSGPFRSNGVSSDAMPLKD